MIVAWRSEPGNPAIAPIPHPNVLARRALPALIDSHVSRLLLAASFCGSDEHRLKTGRTFDSQEQSVRMLHRATLQVLRKPFCGLERLCVQVSFTVY